MTPNILIGDYCDCCQRLTVLLMPVRYDEEGELVIDFECLDCRLDSEIR